MSFFSVLISLFQELREFKTFIMMNIKDTMSTTLSLVIGSVFKDLYN